MKIYTVILLLINLVSFGQDSTLFVGNSMIKYDKNHTLEILENILKNQSKKHYFTDKTSNGTSLYKHLTILPAHKKTFFGASFAFGTDQIEKAEVPAYIIKNRFDNVVFQETPMSVVDSAIFRKKTVPTFIKFDSLSVSHGTQVYWLEPYAAIYTHLNQNSKVNIDSVYQVSYTNFKKIISMYVKIVSFDISVLIQGCRLSGIKMIGIIKMNVITIHIFVNGLMRTVIRH